MTRVKICGITRKEDAELACELGAWALGFIFYPKSPRFVTVEQAAAITDAIGNTFHNGVEKVGVFVDAGFSDIIETGKKAGLTVVQLHGNESRSFAEDLSPYFSDVWKVLRVGDSLPASGLEEFRDFTILLDTYKKGIPGGTGETFSWNVAKEVASHRKIILSGGLNPQNIEEAIRLVAPYAVDISSGVEKCPGDKDHKLIRDLFTLIR